MGLIGRWKGSGVEGEGRRISEENAVQIHWADSYEGDEGGDEAMLMNSTIYVQPIYHTLQYYACARSV